MIEGGTTQYYDAHNFDFVIYMGQHISSCRGMPVSHVQMEGDAVLGFHLHPLSCPKQFFQAYLVYAVRPSTTFKSSSKAITWHYEGVLHQPCLMNHSILEKLLHGFYPDGSKQGPRVLIKSVR